MLGVRNVLKRETAFVLYICAVSAVLWLCGAPPLAAAAADGAVSQPTVTGPRLNAQGQVLYDVDFPVGQPYGAFIATYDKSGKLNIRFFTTREEFAAAQGISVLKLETLDPADYPGGQPPVIRQIPGDTGQSTQHPPTGNAGASPATVHQRVVHAHTWVKDVAHLLMNQGDLWFHWQYNGTNNVYWSAADGAWSWQASGWLYPCWFQSYYTEIVGSSNWCGHDVVGYKNPVWPGAPPAYQNVIES